MEAKNDCWNSLKTKQIKKLAVMAIWQPVGRPTDRRLSRKEPLAPIDLVVDRPAVQKGKLKLSIDRVG